MASAALELFKRHLVKWVRICSESCCQLILPPGVHVVGRPGEDLGREHDDVVSARPAGAGVPGPDLVDLEGQPLHVHGPHQPCLYGSRRDGQVRGAAGGAILVNLPICRV